VPGPIRWPVTSSWRVVRFHAFATAIKEKMFVKALYIPFLKRSSSQSVDVNHCA